MAILQLKRSIRIRKKKKKKVFQIIAIFSPSKRMFLFKRVSKFLFRYNCAIVKNL